MTVARSEARRSSATGCSLIGQAMMILLGALWQSTACANIGDQMRLAGISQSGQRVEKRGVNPVACLALPRDGDQTAAGFAAPLPAGSGGTHASFRRPVTGRVPAMTGIAAGTGDAAKTDGAVSLEGPPVPLPPVARLDGNSSAHCDASVTACTADDGGEPITLHFERAELTAILDAFATFTGLNIIASDNVRGRVSLRLRRVPWRRAFDTLLEAHGLAMVQRGNVIWVTSAQELAARARQRFETHARDAALEPLATRMFELHYQRADDARKLLIGAGNQRMLSKRGSAAADSRTNRLFVTDLAGRLAQVRDMLTAIDQPPRQVLIEARIVEAEDGFARSLGARLALLGGAQPSKSDNSASASSAPRGLVTPIGGNLYDLPAGLPDGLAAATAGFTLFGAGAQRLLALELSALEADGHGRIVANPRVITADSVKALIEQGTELPYQSKVGDGLSGVQFRRAGIKLEVTPRITPDSHVILTLDVTKDSVGAQTAAGPAINTKHVQTQVQVDNGGTVAIGGIYIGDERDDVTRVPWLGKLPLLGALFRRHTMNHSKSELVVFITPNVIAAPDSQIESDQPVPAADRQPLPSPVNPSATRGGAMHRDMI